MKSIRIYFIVIVLGMLSASVTGQEKIGFTPDFRLSQTTAVSSGEDLPFWMTSNQNGIYTLYKPIYLLFQAGCA